MVVIVQVDGVEETETDLSFLLFSFALPFLYGKPFERREAKSQGENARV